MDSLSIEDLNKFKKDFLLEKANLIPNLTEELVEDASDEVDLAQGAALNSMIERLSARKKNNLAKLNEALKRIEEGNFGVCDDCEEPIPAKRLKASPYTTLCVGCAEHQEFLAKRR